MKKHLKLIQSAIELKRKKNLNYSNNAIARDIGVSSSFFSVLINGRKKIPTKLIVKLFSLLEIDDFTQTEILRGILSEKYQGTIFQNLVKEIDSKNPSAFLSVLRSDSHILQKWYILPVLEYLSCEPKRQEFDYIAQMLSISPLDVEEAFLILEGEDLIVKNEQGFYYKTEPYTRVPTTQSENAIRHFHSQMIHKSVEHLDNFTDLESFKNRLITGITVATNPGNIEGVKQFLEKALHDAGLSLSQGDCKEVYQLNIQLFPLTERE